MIAILSDAQLESMLVEDEEVVKNRRDLVS